MGFASDHRMVPTNQFHDFGEGPPVTSPEPRLMTGLFNTCVRITTQKALQVNLYLGTQSSIIITSDKKRPRWSVFS